MKMEDSMTTINGQGNLRNAGTVPERSGHIWAILFGGSWQLADMARRAQRSEVFVMMLFNPTELNFVPLSEFSTCGGQAPSVPCFAGPSSSPSAAKF